MRLARGIRSPAAAVWRRRDRADGVVSRGPRAAAHARADIDYGTATANTAYGTCGIKVWVFKGEIMEHDPMASERRQTEAADQGGQRRREPAQERA